MTTKKCFGRYVCYLIIDPTLAAMASVLLALWEFLAAANTKRRDAFLYRLQVSNKDGKAEATVSAVMSNRRNALMRTHCAHNETVLEICFSVTALILIVTNKV